jgi:hypothetical protein
MMPIHPHAAEIKVAEDSLTPAATPTMAVADPVETSTTNLRSQPMTASNSSDSNQPKQNHNEDTTTASPYGTRSRRREGGVARINYAEDRDVEMEYETPAAKKSSSASAKASNAQTADMEKAPSLQGRRAAATTNGTGGRSGFSTPVAKDDIPGLATFSLAADNAINWNPPTKKRKAPAATTNSPLNSHAASTSSRKAALSSTQTTGTATPTYDTNMVSFDHSQAYLKNGCLIADDKTKYRVNGKIFLSLAATHNSLNSADCVIDNVYLVCEPPGEPYYLARIMEFLHVKNDPNAPVESLRINWIYRPRDIPRKAVDSRLVFATMHSDTCPLMSLRGKCSVLHRSKIENLETYRKTPNSFYYVQLFDRYMHRYYEVIPTKDIINVPQKVKKVLDERWQAVVVEIGRGKELTSAIKTCKRCVGYCARFVISSLKMTVILTFLQQRFGRLRNVQEHLSHELCAASTTQETGSRFCLVLRSLQQKTGAETRGTKHTDA